MRQSLLDRLMAKVEIIPECGCWIFTGASTSFGYGIIGLGSRSSGTDRAHRVAFKLLVGEIPSGMFVCHRCDVPACCNPAHLFLGTAKENHLDMVGKCRGVLPPKNSHDIGSYRYNAKLTEEIVLQARARHKLGESGYSIWKWLKAEFGIKSMAPVYRMLNRETWRHI